MMMDSSILSCVCERAKDSSDSLATGTCHVVSECIL